jgi:hypothetical protein
MNMFKPNHKMKSITLSLLGLAAVTASLSAVGDDQPQTAVDSQAQIGATLNATGDSIQQILDKMSAQKPHDTFQHADYLAKSARNQAKVQAALNNFKNVLATDILPKLESYMADYDSIATSTSYSDAQKNSLLIGLKNQINGLIPALQAQYQAELLKLYSSAGMNLIVSSKSLFLSWTVSCYSDHAYQAHFRDDSNSDRTVFAEDIFPALADGCLSQSCVSLSAVDQMLLYSLIEDDFEHTLSFKLADGTRIELYSNGIAGAQGCAPPQQGWKDLTQEGIDLIGRADFYPVSVSQLPFDATSADIKNLSDPSKKIKVPSADEVNRQARTTSLQAIADSIGRIVRGNLFDGARTDLIDYCNSEAPRDQCMSNSEADEFIKAVLSGRKSSDYPKNYEKDFRYILSQKSSQKYYGTDSKGRIVAQQ